MAKLKHQRAGRLSRRKGKTYERHVANRLKEVYPDAARGLGQERSGGEVADVRGIPGWWVQCKHGAQVNVWTAMLQARDEIEMSKTIVKPIVIARRNRSEDVAVLALGDFIALLAELEELRRERALLRSGALPSRLEDRERAELRAAVAGRPLPDSLTEEDSETEDERQSRLASR